MYTDMGISAPTTVTEDQCGWTEKQMQEQTKTMSRTWDNGGHQAVQILTCKQK